MPIRKNNGLSAESAAKAVFTALGLLNILFVLVICIYLVIKGLPAIIATGPVNFLFGSVWDSSAQEPRLGILPFILTSVYGTAGALILGLPPGFLCAVYISKIASLKLRALLEPLFDLLSGIPSVVYGLIGMLFLVPLVKDIFLLDDGASLFCAIVVLSIMILPSIIKISVAALDAVPCEYIHGSLALGANEIETYFKIVVPSAGHGIAAAVVLGAGRAIGEAMAVMMVAGNASNMPSLFESVRFLTTAVASEMAYSSGLQREALFSIALVLFMFILLINACLNLFLKHGEKHDR